MVQIVLGVHVRRVTPTMTARPRRFRPLHAAAIVALLILSPGSASATTFNVGAAWYQIPPAPANPPQAAITEIFRQYYVANPIPHFQQIKHCSAWFYGSKVVVTAGHCLYYGPSGGMVALAVTDMYFYVGRNGGTWAQECWGSAAPNNKISGGWAPTGGGGEVDWAAVRTLCTVATQFPVYQTDGQNVINTNAWVTGFPDNHGDGNQMWEDYGPITGTGAGGLTVHYLMDIASGDSGGAIFWTCGEAYGYCTRAVITAEGPSYNVGHRFTQANVNRLACFRDTSSTSC